MYSRGQMKVYFLFPIYSENVPKKRYEIFCYVVRAVCTTSDGQNTNATQTVIYV